MNMSVAVQDVLPMMVASSGRSCRCISRMIGRSPKLVSTLIRKDKRAPRLDTCIRIADACGYDVVLVDRKTSEMTHITERAEAEDGNEGA